MTISSARSIIRRFRISAVSTEARLTLSSKGEMISKRSFRISVRNSGSMLLFIPLARTTIINWLRPFEQIMKHVLFYLGMKSGNYTTSPFPLFNRPVVGLQHHGRRAFAGAEKCRLIQHEQFRIAQSLKITHDGIFTVSTFCLDSACGRRQSS